MFTSFKKHMLTLSHLPANTFGLLPTAINTYKYMFTQSWAPINISWHCHHTNKHMLTLSPTTTTLSWHSQCQQTPDTDVCYVTADKGYWLCCSPLSWAWSLERGTTVLLRTRSGSQCGRGPGQPHAPGQSHRSGTWTESLGDYTRYNTRQTTPRETTQRHTTRERLYRHNTRDNT